MLKDDQGWGSTEPRMTHLFAEERPLELGFEGQKVAGRPVEKPENAKTRGGEGIACLGSLAPPGGSPLWPRRMGSQGGRHCRRSLVQRPGDYLKGALGLALGSPIFPSGGEGKLGVALESLQGPRNLT